MNPFLLFETSEQLMEMTEEMVNERTISDISIEDILRSKVNSKSTLNDFYYRDIA